MSALMQSGPPKRAGRAVPVLSWLTPLGAVVSVANVGVALCTGEWLKSLERIPIDSPNGTHNELFQLKRTVSGLWTLCHWNITEKPTEDSESICFGIEYFAKDRYSPEPHDSTMAIPYAATKASPLFVLSAILLLVAIFSAMMGHFSRPRRMAMFVAGIIFIIAGLVMLIGLVVYLSVLQSEIGTKLRPRNSLEDPQFTYSYGLGFILVVIGFMSTELTGISAIFWYIYWHQLDWAQKAVSNSILVSNNHVNQYAIGEERAFTFDPPNPGHVLRNINCQTLPIRRETTNGNNSSKYGWHCDLHYPSENKFAQNSLSKGRSLTSGNVTFKNVDPPDAKVRHHRFYDDFDLDLPFPPPPPLLRDLTATTTISADGFLNNEEGTLNRGSRKNTPV